MPFQLFEPYGFYIVSIADLHKSGHSIKILVFAVNFTENLASQV